MVAEGGLGLLVGNDFCTYVSVVHRFDIVVPVLVDDNALV